MPTTVSANVSAPALPRGPGTRTRLLRAGRSLLARSDVNGFSVDEIVAAADVAKGSFYNYFADKEAFARQIGAAVRRQAESAVNAANAGTADPALRLARALCVFVRFAVEHRDDARILCRLNSGATMADAPVNRGLKEEVMTLNRSLRRTHADAATGVLLVMGTIIITMRHVLERRLTQPPALIARHMAEGMLRGLGVAGARSRSTAIRASGAILGSGDRGRAPRAWRVSRSQSPH